MICGEKTTTQQAIEMEPQIPLRASISMDEPREGDMLFTCYFRLLICFTKRERSKLRQRKRSGVEKGGVQPSGRGQAYIY